MDQVCFANRYYPISMRKGFLYLVAVVDLSPGHCSAGTSNSLHGNSA